MITIECLRLCVIIILLTTAITDNPTAIVEPYSGPDPGFIITQADTGLGNRLRVLAAYLWIAHWKYEGAHVAFIWDVNSACPGHFLQLFKPIPTVIFASNESRPLLEPAARASFPNTDVPFAVIMMMFDVPKRRSGYLTWMQITEKMYSLFEPTEAIMKKVKSFVRRHNICSASAIHIRLTDMAVHLGRKKMKGLNVAAYSNFVESRADEEPVFLMTDDPKIQQHFLNMFGPDKILVYSVMRDDTVFGNSTNSTVPEDHRFSSLEHTLIDVLISAHALHFKGAPFSSLSELVNTFRDIGKGTKGWCKPPF